MVKDVKDLELQLNAAKLKEDALKAAIEEKDAQIEELEAKVPSVKVEKELVVPKQPFEVSGKYYKFNIARFWFNGECQLAEEALNNADLLAEMVERNVVGIFDEVKE